MDIASGPGAEPLDFVFTVCPMRPLDYINLQRRLGEIGHPSDITERSS
jgi:hypothetical protein